MKYSLEELYDFNEKLTSTEEFKEILLPLFTDEERATQHIVSHVWVFTHYNGLMGWFFNSTGPNHFKLMEQILTALKKKAD